jgi:hypothetical protein
MRKYIANPSKSSRTGPLIAGASAILEWGGSTNGPRGERPLG